jgi:hypothetical protein
MARASFNNLTSFIAKVDHNFDENNVLTGRYFFGDSTQAFPLALTASGGQLPGFDTVTPTRVQLVFDLLCARAFVDRDKRSPIWMKDFPRRIKASIRARLDCAT